MISGLNQEVEVLGRTFHFQTELSGSVPPIIRTEVFVGGKVVATRESRLGRHHAELGEDGLKTRMKDHHHKVVDGFLSRARNYHERASHERAGVPLSDSGDSLPPSPILREAASSALAIRRMFGKLRLGVGLTTPITAENIADRLERAARGFAWVVKSPTFSEIRVDEQVHFHLVKDQVDTWLASTGLLPDAVRIWSEIVSLNDYLAEINDRAELLAFDRQVLRWALVDVETKQAIDEPVLEELRGLFGRDLALDEALNGADTSDPRHWVELLRAVLARVLRPT